jgi:hypothetical protein
MSDTSPAKLDRDSTTLLLGVLTAIERDANVTQRSMSSQLGVALGLANAVLKRCARKGLIKISSAPLNRYAYYLTPTGFSEKARLTAEYLRVSFDLFRDARTQYNQIFTAFAKRGLTRIVLAGATELAEAALLSAREARVEIVGLVDARRAGGLHVGLAISGDLGAFTGIADAIVMCDMQNPQTVYEDLLVQGRAIGLDDSRIVGPALLRLRAVKPAESAT